jgi:hypothetical protein
MLTHYANSYRSFYVIATLPFWATVLPYMLTHYGRSYELGRNDVIFNQLAYFLGWS